MRGGPDALELAWETDGDGTGRLECAVSVLGWGGRSEGWFNRNQVLEFADRLRTFPLPADGLPALESGYFHAPPRKGIEVLTINLRAVPIGRRGQVGIEVLLRPWDREPPIPDPQSIIHVRLPCTYPVLQRFADDVEAMVGPEFLDPAIGRFRGRAVIQADRLT